MNKEELELVLARVLIDYIETAFEERKLDLEENEENESLIDSEFIKDVQRLMNILSRVMIASYGSKN
jgi:hypothetical protein